MAHLPVTILARQAFIKDELEASAATKRAVIDECTGMIIKQIVVLHHPANPRNGLIIEMVGIGHRPAFNRFHVCISQREITEVPVPSTPVFDPTGPDSPHVDPAFRKIEITVADPALPNYVLARLVGYLGQSAQP